MGPRAQHTFSWLVAEENLSARVLNGGDNWQVLPLNLVSSASPANAPMLSRLCYVIVDPHGNLSELDAVEVGGIACVYDLQEALKKKHPEIAGYKLMLHRINAKNIIEAEAISKDLSKYRHLPTNVITQNGAFVS